MRSPSGLCLIGPKERNLKTLVPERTRKELVSIWNYMNCLHRRFVQSLDMGSYPPVLPKLFAGPERVVCCGFREDRTDSGKEKNTQMEEGHWKRLAVARSRFYEILELRSFSFSPSSTRKRSSHLFCN